MQISELSTELMLSIRRAVMGWKPPLPQEDMQKKADESPKCLFLSFDYNMKLGNQNSWGRGDSSTTYTSKLGEENLT